MSFYAHPTDLISPGDIFPEIPIPISVPPLKVARKSKFNPPAKFGKQDLRRIYEIPREVHLLPDLHHKSKVGEETIVTTRVGPAIFLSWGSQVESDEREVQAEGKPKRKGWLVAPIYCLQDVPENAFIEDPETHERITMRDVVRNNASHNYFYLPPFPERSDGKEYYVDLRKIVAVGMGFFTDAKGARVASLSEEALNGLFSRLMWFFTRVEYFFRPVRCQKCGTDVLIDVRFEGQNFDAEPWE